MATTFSIEATAKLNAVSEAWEAVRVLTMCVEHVLPGGARFGRRYELSGDKKRWARESLPEMVVVRELYDLDSFVLYWDYLPAGMQWHLRAHTFQGGETHVELVAYAGADLIRTEEAMRTVLARASERGVDMKMGAVVHSSDEKPASVNTEEVVINTGPMKKIRIFRAWVGPHLSAYIVGTVASLTATGLAIWLGVGG